MHVIVLMPTKNEDWILEHTLKTLDTFADRIIIADQHSTDRTRAICAAHEKVQVVDNNEIGHSNKVRWLLLDEARKISGDKLILCIDADEMISKASVEKLIVKAKELGPGSAFSLPWIQLWKSTSTHRVDGIWKKNMKVSAFYDNGTMDYSRTFVINDHTSRIPLEPTTTITEMTDCPLLHLQFAAWNKTLAKQAWYRCSELIASPGTERRINNKYSPSDDSDRVRTEAVPEEWTAGIHLPSPQDLAIQDDSRNKEMHAWFDQYGIEFFEGLQIWNSEELRDLFQKKTGRQPKTKTFPRLLVELNELRNWIRNKLK